MFRQPVDAAEAGEAVGAASADRIGDRSARPAELGADRGAFDVDLRDVELTDLGAQVAEPRVGDVGAIHQVSVVLPSSAGSRSNRAAVLCDAGDQLEQPAIR